MSAPEISNPPVLKNIVIATDFSPASEAAVIYSLGIARRNKAKVWIVHVISDTFFSAETQQRATDDAWREGHRRMTEHFISGRLDGIESKLLVEQGGIFEVLDRVMTESHADLLVLGTRGRSRISKILLGSSAESIFRQAPYPVLTVGPRSGAEVPKDGPQRIMMCTGFSQHSLAACDLAIRLAQRQQAELLLLHVGAEFETEREAYVRRATSRLQALVSPGMNLVSPPTPVVRFGVPSEQILAAANELRPDLIVMGIRQPESFARRLRWATAYDVVTNAPCPVLTVRTPETD